MELITTSVLTLIALYVIYSEPIKLPTIIKKNKKLSYALIIGLYLYYHQNNVVEGTNIKNDWIDYLLPVIFTIACCVFAWCVICLATGDCWDP